MILSNSALLCWVFTAEVYVIMVMVEKGMSYNNIYFFSEKKNNLKMGKRGGRK